MEMISKQAVKETIIKYRNEQTCLMDENALERAFGANLEL